MLVHAPDSLKAFTSCNLERLVITPAQVDFQLLSAILFICHLDSTLPAP